MRLMNPRFDGAFAVGAIAALRRIGGAESFVGGIWLRPDPLR